ncbi:hypothetical protein CGRA01v4_08745 [Colletotrichum graminicola]|nr:hypothetical protein CGRA01v4_08745 [Colletotrichum graminicola]
MRTTNGAITMTSEDDNDITIRAICNAGSSVFYTSAGDIGNFMKPSVCGYGITKAVGVRSRAQINPVREGNKI